MLKFINSTILLPACMMLMIGFTSVHAQETNTLNTVAKKDSVLKDDLERTKRELYQQLLQNIQGYEINQDMGNVAYNLGYPLNIELSDHVLRFNCTNNRVIEIRFYEMTDNKLKIFTTNSNIQNGMSVTEYKLKIGSSIISVRNERQFILKSITGYLLKIQKLTNDLGFNVNAFDQMAAVYKASPVKPAISEEQRKNIIQAEVYAKLYQYEKAINLLKRVISIHPTSYPNAYMDMAILLAETNRLYSAIYNMKKFLLLNPGAADEQFAKSRISDWEIMMNN